jgi:hypothetical protein
MPRQIVVSKSLIAANAALFAASQAVVSGTPMTLTGVAADTQRRVILTVGSEAAQRTLLLVGLNGAGAKISETLTVPATTPGTIASQQDFLSLISATPTGGGWSANAELGTNTVGSTPWFVPDLWLTPTLLEVATELATGGTANWSVEVTDDDPKMPLAPFQPGYSQALPICNPVAWTGLSAISGNASAVINTPVQAWRLTINSGTSQVTAKVQQAGLAQ